MRRVLIVFGLLAAAFLATVGTHQYAVPALINLRKRGRRLTVTAIGDDKSIDEAPADLAAAAGDVLGRAADINAYALARMLKSEESSQPPEVKNLIAHVALNVAASRGVSLLRLLTASTVASRDGKFGRQISRWAATTSDPWEQDYGIAEQAIAEHAAGADPTGGAVHFVDRLAFGIQPGTGSYSAVVEKWRSEGVAPVRIPPAPWRLVFFRRATAADEAVS